MERSRREQHIGVVDVLTVEPRCVGVKQLADGGDVFVSETASVREVGAEIAILLFDVTDADRQGESATAQVADRRSLFRDEEWITLGEDQNPRAELNPVGACREIAECCEGLQYVPKWFAEACG